MFYLYLGLLFYLVGGILFAKVLVDILPLVIAAIIIIVWSVLFIVVTVVFLVKEFQEIDENQEPKSWFTRFRLWKKERYTGNIVSIRDWKNKR